MIAVGSPRIRRHRPGVAGGADKAPEAIEDAFGGHQLVAFFRLRIDGIGDVVVCRPARRCA